VFDAAYAEKIGLITQVVADPTDLAAACDQIADQMMACAPGAVARPRSWSRTWPIEAIDHGLMEETAKRIARARVGEEGQEGVRAFLDKRKPVWAQ